jgi:hypothetical protein
MADKKNPIIDFGINVLRELLGAKPGAAQGGASNAPAAKVKLDDVPLDDLKREKVRLEQEERKMLAELKDLEAQKRKLFEEGVRNASEREQRVAARRIKEIDVQCQNIDTMLQSISKQMRILNGLMQVKERARLNKESGIARMIDSIDLGDLITYIDNASVDGEFHMNKFDELLRSMEKAQAVSPLYVEDDDVLDIVKQMQMAREAADSAESLEKSYNDMNRSMEAKSKKKEADEEEF